MRIVITNVCREDAVIIEDCLHTHLRREFPGIQSTDSNFIRAPTAREIDEFGRLADLTRKDEQTIFRDKAEPLWPHFADYE